MKAEQIARQLEAAFAKVSSPVDVIVLLDGSSSVSSTQFEIMRLCTRQIVDMFPSQANVRMGLVQFSDNIKIECNLESNKQTVNCSITAMVQIQGGTNAKAAFENAKFLFETYHRPASRCVVFFTDGDCSNGVATASSLRDKNSTHIVAIGINLKNATDLAKIASNNSYFLFDSFENLRDVFTYLYRTASSPPKLEILARGSRSATLRIELPPEVVSTKRWEVEMFDFERNEWLRMGSSQGEIQSLRLEANKKYNLRARTLFLNDVWSQYSPEFEFRTMEEHKLYAIIQDPRMCANACKQLVASLCKKKPNKRLREAGVSAFNLLLLGRMGAGKSAFLTTVASAINGQYTPLSPFRSDLTTVTKTFKTFPLTRGKRAPQIRMADVYGWSESNYKNNEVGYMLDGHMKSGYAETTSDFITNTKHNPKYRPNPRLCDKIHAVIVAVSAATVGSRAEMGRLGEFHANLTTRGYSPIFVLTKVDRLPDEILIGNHANVLDSGVVDVTVQNFSDLSQIPRASVLPVINYQGPYATGPDYVIELLALHALAAAVRAAETFLTAHEDAVEEENSPDEAKGKDKKKKPVEELSKRGKSKQVQVESEDSDEGYKSPSTDEGSPFNSDNETSYEAKTKDKATKKATKPAPVITANDSAPSSSSANSGSPANQPPANQSPIGRVLTLAEAAAYLDAEEHEVEELLEEKKISGKKIGVRWKITKEAIDKYLNSD